jgi:hypothetical protein
MAFPANLTNAIDGVTDVIADHLNNLEAKVGIDGSLVTTSLDYLLKNPASISPGHRHVNLYKPDGSLAVAVNSNGNTGIATTTPSNLLTIAQQADVDGLKIYGYDDRAANYISIGVDTSGQGQITADKNFQFYTGGSLAVYWGGSVTYYRNILPNADNSKDLGSTSLRWANLYSINGYFGNAIGIGTTSPNAAALLHLSSTTKGFLPPVMTTAQKTAISSPPAGLVVYDSTLKKLCVYTGSAWETITSA